MKKAFSPQLLMILSMAVFGTIGLFVKQIGVSSAELALYRAVLAILLIGLFLLITRQSIPLRAIKKELFLLFLSGAAMGINWILLFEAYRYTTVSVATLSYYFAPVIVTVACPLLFRERLSAKQIICFCASTVGLVLLIGVKAPADSPSHLTGILFGLGAAVFYATVILLNKRIRTVGGIPRTFLQFCFALPVLLPYVLFQGEFGLGTLDGIGWAALLAVGLLHSGVAYCMYFSSMRELPGQRVALLSYIDPLVAILVSVIFLRESISVGQIVGGALILGFTLWNEIPSKKKAA